MFSASRLTTRSLTVGKFFTKPFHLQTPSKPFSLPKLTSPLRKITFQHRFASTSAQPQSITSNEAHEILVSQRLKRPISPHLSIYQPQITWYGSALNRITGSILAGGIYLYFTAYVIAPYIGWHLESQSIAAAFATLPVAAKVAIKGLVAFPFTFHSFNGVRHLVWDTGKAMGIKTVYKTGYAVLGLSILSTIYLALI